MKTLTCIRTFILVGAFAFGSPVYLAQPLPIPKPSPSATPDVSPNAKPTATPDKIVDFLKDIGKDQKAIWLSPFNAKGKDLEWMVPLGMATATLLATDSHTSGVVSTGGSLPTVSKYVSYPGTGYGMGGIAVGMYLIGRASGNDRLRRTGRMATAAVINTYIVTGAFKYTMGRLRPSQDNGRGRFFQNGRSFFSGHSSGSFAVATVVACNYKDEPIIRYGAYAAASAIALSRYSGRNHFLGDILMGTAVGYGIGRYICRKPENAKPDDQKGQATDPAKFGWTPMVVPYFDRRTGTYGGRMTWLF